MVELIISHIVSDPSIRRGRPYIKGTGITVQNIVEDVAAGLTVDYLTEQFDLTLGQVHAALSYYYDHQAVIDQTIAEDKVSRERLQESDEYRASQERIQQIKACLEVIRGASPNPE
jgi:uncharacterized protein (DUF433 family)